MTIFYTPKAYNSENYLSGALGALGALGCLENLERVEIFKLTKFPILPNFTTIYSLLLSLVDFANIFLVRGIVIVEYEVLVVKA